MSPHHVAQMVETLKGPDGEEEGLGRRGGRKGGGGGSIPEESCIASQDSPPERSRGIQFLQLFNEFKLEFIVHIACEGSLSPPPLSLLSGGSERHSTRDVTFIESSLFKAEDITGERVKEIVSDDEEVGGTSPYSISVEESNLPSSLCIEKADIQQSLIEEREEGGMTSPTLHIGGSQVREEIDKGERRHSPPDPLEGGEEFTQFDEEEEGKVTAPGSQFEDVERGSVPSPLSLGETFAEHGERHLCVSRSDKGVSGDVEGDVSVVTPCILTDFPVVVLGETP
jgi:hypothetical protein